MTDDERDEYFHRVEVTAAMLGALESKIKAHNGQKWALTFNQVFQFHVVDKSHPMVARDYGWYYSWGELTAKLRREIPDLVLDELLTN